MKTFTKILTAAAATALLATGCVNEDPAYKNNEPGTPPDPNAKGYLTLADMSMRVVVDTDTETRPDDTSDETAKPQTRTDEAQPDVDTFIIEIRDATGKLALTVDPANEGPSIVGVDFNIDETQTPSADRDTEIDITAQTGIKSLDVTIDCDNLDARELGTMGIPARFDLCNI